MAIDTISAQAAAIIAAATPDYEPLITYREARKDIPLEQQRPTLSPSETTRQFQVVPLLGVGFSKWKRNLTQAYLVQGLEVKIRYQIPREDDGWYRLLYMAATDEARITHDLALPPSSTTWGSNTVLRDIQPVAIGQKPAPILEHGPDLWLVTLNYAVSYAIQ